MKRAIRQKLKQGKLSVPDSKKRLAEADKKLDDLIVTEAEGFPTWSTLDDKVTAVQSNPTRENIEALSREIDEAAIAAPGEQALITVNQGTKLQTRLSGIEKNPAAKKRPSLTRGHTALGRLRAVETGVVKKPLNEEGMLEIIAIENRYTKLGEELDRQSDLIIGDKDYDAKMTKIFENLSRPVVEEVVLSGFDNLLRGLSFAIGIVPPGKEDVLVNKKIKALQEQEFWDTLSKDDKAAIRIRLERGDTVDNIVRLATE